MTNLSDTQIERWRLRAEDAANDEEWVTERQRIAQAREAIRPDILSLLHRFVHREIGTKELRAEFDRKTRTVWNSLSWGGPSGAMILNMLVKYAPDEAELEREVRQLVPVPRDEEQAHARLGEFSAFVRHVAATDPGRGGLHDRRAPFLTSAWWHVQQPELWPVAYPSSLRALGRDEVYEGNSDPVEGYFAFRTAYFTLSSALNLSSFQLESLCRWLDTGQVKATPAPQPPEKPAVRGAGSPDGTSRKPEREHTHIQWVLAKIGRELGCRVWIAANDRSERWGEELLGDLSVDELPALGIEPDSQRLIRLIDVLWIMGKNRVVAALEVEHTTSIYSGLLRMSDLVSLSPNLTFPLYIVAPQTKRHDVQRQLERPTFRALELNERCGYIAAERLLAHADAILTFGTEPGAINPLVEYLGRTEDGG